MIRIPAINTQKPPLSLYICVCVCVCMYLLTPLYKQDGTQGKFFNKFEFSFPSPRQVAILLWYLPYF